MIQSYLTSVWRYISRNKGFTAINILGLVTGMTAFMLIGQYVRHELSYDDFWTHKDRVYRVRLDRYNKGEVTTQWAAGCIGIGPDLQRDFPEVESYTRLKKSQALLSHGDVFFREDGVYYTSQDFFKVFGYHLSEGVDSTALKAPNQMVLSRSLARKYFGDGSPLGKTMRNNGETEYLITGVFEDLPGNTHMKIDALLSFQTYARLLGRKDESELNEWQWDGFLTYVLLAPRVDPAGFQAKLPAYVEKRAGEDLKNQDAGMVFHIQPLTDIHLDSDYIGEFKANGSRQTANFLSIIAVLVILIAWINYVNLSTAKSIERAREVGVRKVMGSFRRQLVQQFLFESLLMNAAAVTVAIALVWALTPWFSELTGRRLEFTLIREPMFWALTGSVIIGGALLSGLYPAFILSSFRPVEVLKGKFRNTNQGVLFRKGMVVIQFVASITLIVGTYTVYQQIQYMRDQQLGISIEQTVVLRPPNVTDSTYLSKFEFFKQRIVQYPEVSRMAASTAVPGERPDWNAGGIRRLSQRPEEANQYRVIMMDHDFGPLIGMEAVAGRLFSGESPNEGRNVMLNESGARLMGFTKFDEAINDQINFWGDTFRIVGVVKNYRQESLKKEFEPLIFRYGQGQGFYAVKFKTANVRESMARFEKDWKDLFPGNPFEYFFLDEFYNGQYKADQQFGKAFGLFSGLAIFIAALGLFGLSSLTALQRTKEIGVRKVLGASTGGIIAMVSRDYLILIGIAILFATPVAFWVMTGWLSEFANRIPLSWWIFAAPSLLVVAIALLTVSIHTLKAARTNPATSLRYE
jgi:putative ABC transport system permease protein